MIWAMKLSVLSKKKKKPPPHDLGIDAQNAKR